MRTLFVTAVTVGLFALASGCTASTATDAASTDDAALALATGPSHDALVATIKAAYEASVHASSDHVFPGEHAFSASRLKGAAREAWREYENCTEEGLRNDVGAPIIRVATVSGATVYFVAGDVSDTGSEYGFYDAQFKVLALAYSGQGEHPDASGVDWMQ
jgi:hypothetical protein